MNDLAGLRVVKVRGVAGVVGFWVYRVVGYLRA